MLKPVWGSIIEDCFISSIILQVASGLVLVSAIMTFETKGTAEIHRYSLYKYIYSLYIYIYYWYPIKLSIKNIIDDV